MRSGPSSSLEIEIGGATSDPLPSMTLAAQWVCTGDVEAIEEGVERPEAAQRLSLRVLEQSIPSRVPGTALETRVGQLLADLLACAEAVERAPHAEEGEEGRGDRSSCRASSDLCSHRRAATPLSSADVASGLEAIVEPEPTGAAAAAARSHAHGGRPLPQRLVICAPTSDALRHIERERPPTRPALALLQLWMRSERAEAALGTQRAAATRVRRGAGRGGAKWAPAAAPTSELFDGRAEAYGQGARVGEAARRVACDARGEGGGGEGGGGEGGGGEGGGGERGVDGGGAEGGEGGDDRSAAEGKAGRLDQGSGLASSYRPRARRGQPPRALWTRAERVVRAVLQSKKGSGRRRRALSERLG